MIGWFLLGMAAGFILLMALCAAFPPRPGLRVPDLRDEAGAVEGGRIDEGRR